MKKMKMVKRMQVVVLAMVLAFSFTACGKKAIIAPIVQTELSGLYASNENVAFMSAYPAYTYKQATFSVQTIEIYTDNTYCLTNTSTMFSGALTFSDSGEHTEVPRGSDITKYYGTFTSKDEEGLKTITMSTATSVVANLSFGTSKAGIGYVNTKEWTEAMGTATGTAGATLTAEQYLAKVALPETSVIVDTTNSLFQYIAPTAAAK